MFEYTKICTDSEMVQGAPTWLPIPYYQFVYPFKDFDMNFNPLPSRRPKWLTSIFSSVIATAEYGTPLWTNGSFNFQSIERSTELKLLADNAAALNETLFFLLKLDTGIATDILIPLDDEIDSIQKLYA